MAAAGVRAFAIHFLFVVFFSAGHGLSQVSVVVTSNGVPIATVAQAMQAGFGQDAFVWSATVPTGAITEDITYTVSLQNLVIGGVSSNISYSAILFNPSNSAAAPSAITLPATGVTNDSSLGTARALLNGTVNPG